MHSKGRNVVLQIIDRAFGPQVCFFSLCTMEALACFQAVEAMATTLASVEPGQTEVRETHLRLLRQALRAETITEVPVLQALQQRLLTFCTSAEVEEAMLAAQEEPPVGDPPARTVRRNQQDFQRFDFFLPGSLWEDISQPLPARDRMDILLRWLAKALRLECPSEATFSKVVAVAAILESGGPTTHRLHELLCQAKDAWKSIAKWSKKNLERSPRMYLLVLPVGFEDLPSEWLPHLRRPEEPVAVNPERLQLLADRVPLRRTHSAVSVPPLAGPMLPMHPMDALVLGRMFGGGHVPFVPTSTASPPEYLQNLVINPAALRDSAIPSTPGSQLALMPPATPAASVGAPAAAEVAVAQPKRRRISGKGGAEARSAEAQSVPVEILRAAALVNSGSAEAAASSSSSSAGALPAAAASTPSTEPAPAASPQDKAEATLDGSYQQASGPLTEEIPLGADGMAKEEAAATQGKHTAKVVPLSVKSEAGKKDDGQKARRTQMAEVLQKKEKEKRQAAAKKRPAAASKAKGGTKKAEDAAQPASAKAPATRKRPAAALKAAPTEEEDKEGHQGPVVPLGDVAAQGAEVAEEFCNVEFSSASYGRCKREHYSKKSYIRHWQESDRKWRMIIGSEDSQHHRHVTRLLQADVMAGKDRNALKQARAAYLEMLNERKG